MSRSFVFGAAALLVFALIWQLGLGMSAGGAQTSLSEGFASLATFGGLPQTAGNAALVVTVRAGETLSLLLISVIIAYPLALLTASALHALRPHIIAPGAPLLLMRTLPLIGLVPIFNRWFGDALIGQIGYVAWASFVVIASHIYLALPRVSPALEDAARIFGADQRKTWVSLRWPTVQRHLLGSYESLAAQVWAFTLAAEFLSPSRGLGQMVIGAYQRADVAQLAALVLVYGLLGVITIGGFRAVARAIPSLRNYTEALS